MTVAEVMDEKTYKELTKPFTDKEIEKAPKGKFGDFVPHHIITKRLNEVVPGRWTFELKEIIRNKEGEVEGAVCRMTIQGLGYHDEVGDVDRNDKNNFGTESQLLKLTFSDAIKRCAMRFGIGLHLWTGEETAWFDSSKSSSNGTQAKSGKQETKPVQVTEQTQNASPDLDPLKRSKDAIQYIRHTLLFETGIQEGSDEEKRIIRKLVDYGKKRMLKKDASIETYTDTEFDKLLDKIADFFEKNKDSLINTASDKNLSSLSDAGLEAEKIEKSNTKDVLVVGQKEEEVVDIPEGKWMQEEVSEAQMNFIVNTLIPECIDAGADKEATEAKKMIESGELNKGTASDLITKLKAAKSK